MLKLPVVVKVTSAHISNVSTRSGARLHPSLNPEVYHKNSNCSILEPLITPGCNDHQHVPCPVRCRSALDMQHANRDEPSIRDSNATEQVVVNLEPNGDEPAGHTPPSATVGVTLEDLVSECLPEIRQCSTFTNAAAKMTAVPSHFLFS